MPVDRDLAQRVLAEIDRNELGELGRALTDIPSPTGQEQALAEFILSWFAANGMKPIRRQKMGVRGIVDIGAIDKQGFSADSTQSSGFSPIDKSRDQVMIVRAKYQMGS